MLLPLKLWGLSFMKTQTHQNVSISFELPALRVSVVPVEGVGMIYPLPKRVLFL